MENAKKSNSDDQGLFGTWQAIKNYTNESELKMKCRTIRAETAASR